jgi:PAS domain S-box-containing protein
MVDPDDELRMVNKRLLVAGLRQQELAAEAERGRRAEATLLESVAIGIIGFDDALRCTSINRTAAQLIDTEPAAVLGRDIHGVLHGGCDTAGADPACLLIRVLRGDDGIRVEDGALWRSDGSPFPAMYSADPVVFDGHVRGRVITFADITERKRIEMAVLQAGQAEQRLDGVKLAVREVAHLLNNDLALAVGTLELLLGDHGLSTGTLEGMQTALAACAAAAEHLAKFQRVVRVETQETPIGLTLDVNRSI